MKALTTTIVAVLVLLSSASADEWRLEPVHSMLFNRFTRIQVEDSCALALAQDAIVALEFLPSDGTFEEKEHLLLGDAPCDLRVFDSLALVKLRNNHLVVLDVRELPHIDKLGELAIEEDYGDYVLADGDLYVSRWFDGIHRYRLQDYDSAWFVDSSMKPVLASQLALSEDRLLALDLYNGILPYDLAGDGFGQHGGYLFVPRRSTGFVADGDRFLISLMAGGLYFGEFGHTGSGVVDSIGEIPSLQRAFPLDEQVVCIDDRTITAVSRGDHTQRHTVPLEWDLPFGDILMADGRDYLVLPGTDGGLGLYELEGDYDRFSGFKRPGPIRDMLFHRSFLHVGGANGPVEVFDVDSCGEPSRLDSLTGASRDADLLFANGDTIMAVASEAGRIAFYQGRGAVAKFVTARDLPEVSYVNDFWYAPSLAGRSNVLVVAGSQQVWVYELSAGWSVQLVAEWEFEQHIAAIAVDRDRFYLATDQAMLQAYEVGDDLVLLPRGYTDLCGYPYEMILLPGGLVVAGGQRLCVIDVFIASYPDIDTVLHLPFDVFDVEAEGLRLYTVGSTGVGVFGLRGGSPYLLGHGGRPGTMLAAHGDIVATSDGSSVHTYKIEGISDPSSAPSGMPRQFTLKQNYPNPFNAGTTIAFDLFRTVHVRLTVYNVLGQEVKRLIDGVEVIGPHSVTWNGDNNAGDRVASGVYFYRFETSLRTETRKMLLLR